MQVFLNGRFVPVKNAVVPVLDRGFLYGDGLFETLLVRNSHPFRWARHIERLQLGARFLGIPLPFAPARLRAFAAELLERNRMPDAILRVTLSRGSGPRGYSPRGADQPVCVMTAHPAPAANGNPLLKLAAASTRLPAGEPLAGFKTCNKLVQILARREAQERGADEAILLNTRGKVAEADSSNVFWIQRGEVRTPPMAAGILGGVTRQAVLEICASFGVPWAERDASPAQLFRADGVFLTSSVRGVAAAGSLDGRPLKQSPLVTRLQAEYRALILRETA